MAMQIKATWLSGLPEADVQRGNALADELVADWRHEAAGKPEARAILDILRGDLEAAGRDRSAAERLQILKAQVLGRKVNRLSVETFELGKAVVDGTLPNDMAKPRGEALLARIQPLGAEIQTLPDEDARRRLQRELGECMMDALYAVEGKAMSLRLNRYQHP